MTKHPPPPLFPWPDQLARAARLLDYIEEHWPRGRPRPHHAYRVKHRAEAFARREAHEHGRELPETPYVSQDAMVAAASARGFGTLVEGGRQYILLPLARTRLANVTTPDALQRFGRRRRIPPLLPPDQDPPDEPDAPTTPRSA